MDLSTFISGFLIAGVLSFLVYNVIHGIYSLFKDLR